MLEDTWLLWQFKRGSSEALEKIYQKYESYLITVATALVNNTHAAEDVLHDVFVNFVKSADRIKLNGSLKSYLAVCVANHARNQLKKGRRESVGLSDDWDLLSPEWPAERTAMQREQTAVLNRALGQLPYEQREVIVLHLQANMRFAQIAQLQNTSANTIRSRYRYGLDKLRTLLNSEVMP